LVVGTITLIDRRKKLQMSWNRFIAAHRWWSHIWLVRSSHRLESWDWWRRHIWLERLWLKSWRLLVCRNTHRLLRIILSRCLCIWLGLSLERNRLVLHVALVHICRMFSVAGTAAYRNQYSDKYRNTKS